MIEYRSQSVFDFSNTSVIAHGVNCQGRMNSGVAKQVRAQYPKAYEEYMKLCLTGDSDESFIFGRFCGPNRANQLLGLSQIVKDKDTFIANLFTQNFYGKDGAKYADQTSIHTALIHLAYSVQYTQSLPKSIAMPKIGCGLGGLDWDSEVEPILREVHRNFPLDFIVCSIWHGDQYTHL